MIKPCFICSKSGIWGSSLCAVGAGWLGGREGGWVGGWVLHHPALVQGRVLPQHVSGC
jgi:hypothetical protein